MGVLGVVAAHGERSGVVMMLHAADWGLSGCLKMTLMCISLSEVIWGRGCLILKPLELRGPATPTLCS